MTYALLMAGLLGTTSTSPSAGAPPEQGPRKELVIPFAWQPTEQWQVEIREYQFRRGVSPKLQPVPWNIVLRAEAIEAQYSPDLRALFERAKNQDR
jgi:hypothetical protein